MVSFIILPFYHVYNIVSFITLSYNVLFIMLNVRDFISGILTVISLFSFATSNLIHHEKIGTKELQTAMKWGSLVSSSFLVFSVQLGVQTMPSLLSGVLFPANDRSTLKGITRSIQCILLVTVLKV